MRSIGRKEIYQESSSSVSCRLLRRGKKRLGEKEKKQAADFPNFPANTIGFCRKKEEKRKRGNRFGRILFCSQRNGFSANLSELQDICTSRTNLLKKK
ncbi:hypothetical protein CEXT_238161 [Caerostris extrusa]|uniref:Uncharacterized protein n=1 Tax=Caerostris extrusa TaxID=172846 RepID=A0AAV4RJ51_CAEEX|nr:hypothetical protein CEXT_238161 [Caerostris extrusa]